MPSGRDNFDFDISLTSNWLAMSKGLKSFSPELRKELHRELKKAAKPLVKEARDAIRENYPQRGGLAEEMAKPMHRRASNGKKAGSAITPIVLTGRFPGVGIRIRSVGVKTIENWGFFRHPVHARPDREENAWVGQGVPLAGLIRDRVWGRRDVVVPAINQAIEKTAAKIIERAGR